MIILSDLLVEADRLMKRASNDRKPIDARRLAILVGAEVIDLKTAAAHLHNGPAIRDYAKSLGETGEPGAILVDTGSASRAAIILVNAEAETIEGRTLIALLLANSALEPSRTATLEGVRLIAITLPCAATRTVQGDNVYDAGMPVRLDRSGANLAFRPVAEAAVHRLALSLLVSNEEISASADWVGNTSDEARIERMSARLARQAGVPADWAEYAMRRYLDGAKATSDPRVRRTAA